MSFERIALWVLGPIGSGKSTLIERTLPAGFHIIDQDLELERRADARGLPLDCRTHDAAQAAAFAEIRRQAADDVWALVPRWRAEGAPIAFQTPGDKPHLLQCELDDGRAAGYRNLGIGLRVPEEVCLQRNRQRRRIVPDAIVVRTLRDFEENVRAGVYERMFDRGAFIVVPYGEPFHIGRWLQSQLA